MKFLKRLFFILLIVFLLIQFIPRPEKNNDNKPQTGDISMVHSVPANVQNILKASCYDCHSNNTTYPWYSKIQPVAWWLGDHIKEGKSELNFSVFGTYSLRRQFKKLEEIEEQVSEGEMPLKSYTLIHTDAKISGAQKTELVIWSRALQDSFKNNYPKDSLQRKNPAALQKHS